MRTTGKRILSLALAMLLALGTLPQTVFAAGESEGGKITAFAALEEDVANQTKPLGTALAELNLPDTLTATVEVEPAKEQPDNVRDSGDPAQGDTDTDTQGGSTDDEASVSGNDVPEPDGDEENEEVFPVTWVADPIYDPVTVGTYIFSPVLPEGYSLAQGVIVPVITVTAEPAGIMARGALLRSANIVVNLADLTQDSSGTGWSYNAFYKKLFIKSADSSAIFRIIGGGDEKNLTIRLQGLYNDYSFSGTIILDNVNITHNGAALDFADSSTATLKLIGENRFESSNHAGVNASLGNLTIQAYDEKSSSLTAIAGDKANGIGTGEDEREYSSVSDQFGNKPDITITGNCTVTVHGTADGNALGAQHLTIGGGAALILNNEANTEKSMDTRTARTLSNCAVTGSAAGNYAGVYNISEIKILSIAAVPEAGGNPLASLSISGTEGRQITLKANPNFGYTFTGWTVASPPEFTLSDAGNSTVTFAEPTGLVKIVANYTLNIHNLMVTAGDGGSVTPSGTSSTAVGAPVTITASAYSGYAFQRWEVTGISVNNTAAISFDMPDNAVTLRAVFQYVGGGSSHDSDSDSSSKPEVTVLPGAQPDWPTIGSVIGKVAGATAQRTFTVTDSLMKSALEKAQAEAQAKNRTAYGIGIQLALDTPAAAGLTATLERAALNRLVSEKAVQFEITGAPIALTLDAKALAELEKQSTGNVTITVKPVTVQGVRNAYDISFTTIKDGKSVGITSLGTGSATLSVPFTPAKGEAAGGFYAVYVDETGKANHIAGSAYDVNSRSIMFTTTHFSVYGVSYTAPSAKFTDISSHWAKESIDYVVGRGLLSGTSDTAFSPDTAMTRGMLVTALGRLAGVDVKAYTVSSFTDVKADSTFRPYIGWAYQKGIVQGVGNSQFAPDRAITREKIAVIFANYAKATGYTLPVTRNAAIYADDSGIGNACKTAVTAMQQAGIMMGGTNNRFNPKSSATRAEVSAMLHRYIKLTIDPDTAQGWAKNDDGQYLYYKDGKALSGTQIIDGVKYFFNTDGTLKTGWVKDDSENWRFYDRNTMLVGWRDIGADSDSKRYYFDTYGNMASGKWLLIDGKWYYFYADGSLANSTKIGEYEVDENGVRKDT